MKSQTAPPVFSAEPPKKRRGLTCLLWLIALTAGLLLISVVGIGGAYAGWTSGLATAQANMAQTAAAALQRQCDLIPRDLAEGSYALAERRLQDLQQKSPAPACLSALLRLATALAPTATAMQALPQASPTAPPTATAAVLEPTAIPSIAPTLAIASGSDSFEYDLEALLTEARGELSGQNYPAAIDTLDAIISIDEGFQSELVRRLFLEALKAQAQALYRSGKLSEAIVLTGRAEAYGDIGTLQYERFIALLYLDGGRLKANNPAEAVRLLNRIIYEQGLPNYMNGAVIAELQEALRNYGDAFSFQGDPCSARTQYEAALDLHPARGSISRGELTNKRQAAAQACGDQPLSLTTSGADTASSTHSPIGVRRESG